MKVYSTTTGRIKKRRRIGEFTDKIRAYKRSFDIEMAIRHENKMLTKYGLKTI